VLALPLRRRVDSNNNVSSAGQCASLLSQLVQRFPAHPTLPFLVKLNRAATALLERQEAASWMGCLASAACSWPGGHVLEAFCVAIHRLVYVLPASSMAEVRWVITCSTCISPVMPPLCCSPGSSLQGRSICVCMLATTNQLAIISGAAHSCPGWLAQGSMVCTLHVCCTSLHMTAYQTEYLMLPLCFLHWITGMQVSSHLCSMLFTWQKMLQQQHVQQQQR
jgi:hypothetical protein